MAGSPCVPPSTINVFLVCGGLPIFVGQNHNMSRVYQTVNESDLTSFRSILGSDHVLVDVDSRQRYGRDETENLVFPPEVVAPKAPLLSPPLVQRQ